MKKMKWPAIVASTIVAIGLMAGVVMNADTKPLQLDLPIYGDNIWYKFGDGYTSEDYDDIAEFDMMIFGHELYLNDKHIGLIDSVRTRNPDFIPLFYAFVYGLRPGWEHAGGFYTEFYNMVNDNDWWLRDYHGDIVVGPATNDPTIPVQFLNCGAPGLAEGVAKIHAKWMYNMGHVRPHSGMFLDWMTVPYPQWPFPTPRGDLDFNRNGIPASEDPGDAEQNAAYPYQIAKAFRNAFSSEPTFLLMPNGNVHYANNAEYAHLWDGGMYELVNLYYPKPNHWAKAVIATDGFDKSRVNPPLLMFQGGENDSIGFPSEALASIANGVCNFQFRNLDRKLSLGKIASEPVWSGDTVSAFFDDGQKRYVVRAVATDYIWPYLITSYDGADTLSRGGGWPAQEVIPPSLWKFDMPIYGTWVNDDTPIWTEAGYDSVGNFTDVYTTGHYYMLASRTGMDGIVDSLRVRNPNLIFLNYVFVYGVFEEWETAGTMYTQLWNIGENNSDGYQGDDGVLDFWLYDTDGNHTMGIHGDRPIWMYNLAAPGIADTLAAFYIDRIKVRDGLKSHVGFLTDYLNGDDYPAWSVDGDLGTLDMDEDGIPYDKDPDERELYLKFVREWPDACRRAAGRSDFLNVVNGSAGRIKATAGYYDGVMLEDFHFSNIYPASRSQLVEAIMEVAGWLDNSRVDPPIIQWFATHDSSGTTGEALASIGIGSAQFTTKGRDLQSPSRNLDFGKIVPKSVTISTDNPPMAFAKFYDGSRDTTYVWCVWVNGTMPMPYLITKGSTGIADADTIARGGGWPAQEVPVTELQLILEDYNNYLTKHMGETINLSVIAYWAGTTAAILEECEK